MLYRADSNHDLCVSRRAFTLTEAAIVMAIIGVVLTGIWIAFASVVSNSRLHSLNNNIGIMTNNLRTFLGIGSQRMLDMAMTGEEGAVTMARIGVVPSDMWDDPTNVTSVIHPWGGVVTMTALRIDVDGDGVEIGLLQLPQSACADLLVRLTGVDRDVGLIRAGTATGSHDVTQMPIPLSAAVNDCSAALNDVHFQYRLK